MVCNKEKLGQCTVISAYFGRNGKNTLSPNGSIPLGQGFCFSSFISNFSTCHSSEVPIHLLTVIRKYKIKEKIHRHDSVQP